jgi:hypothetical protein
MTFMARSLSYASGYRGSMTAGFNSPASYTGFVTVLIGSLTNNGYLGGTIASLYDNAAHGILQVTGLSANPGQSVFTKITASGASGSPKTSASATYGYSGSTATWTWSTKFGFGNGGVYPIVIQ